MKKLIILLFLAASITVKAQSGKPNIIFIMADDLGWGELNDYGSTFNETPNLTRLARQGARFTQAYTAAPNCSPTRVSILTGQYPARVGITDFLPEGNKTEKYLDPAKYFTLNEALSKAGYHTGIVGKWHMDTHHSDYKGGPEAHGFDEVIGSETKYIADGDYFFPYDKIDSFNTGAENEYLTDRQNQEAISFIERNKAKPFFLYLSYYSVHTKLEAKDELVAKYKKKFDQKYGAGMAEKTYSKGPGGPHKDNPYLAAMLESIDEGIGSIGQKLDELNLDENTIIVFYSDNGGAGKGANNGHLRDSKMSLYEGGIRVPFIMKWPAKIKPGIVNNTPVSSMDFYPTFLAAAGTASEKGQQLDGMNILPLFSDQNLDRKEFFWHYPSETARNPTKMASVIRQDNLKLMYFYEDKRLELYDLKRDAGEKKNLASAMPEKAKELLQKLEKWKLNVGAEIPVLP